METTITQLEGKLESKEGSEVFTDLTVFINSMITFYRFRVGHGRTEQRVVSSD